jgi:hypothetical protein
MQSFEYAGYWWLPQAEENKICGTVRYSPEAGIELSLLGSFKPIEKSLESSSYDLILGLTEQGKVFTLFDCLETGSAIRMAGLITQRLDVRLAFLGAHFDTPDDLRFQKATAQYTHLPVWAGVSGLALNWDTAKGQLSKFQVTYDYPEEVAARITVGELALTYAFESKRELLTDLALRESLMFRLDYFQPVTIDDVFAGFITPMQNFFTLATGVANAVAELIVYSAASVRLKTDGTDRPRPIEVFFQRVFNDPIQERPLTPDKVLFTLNDILPDFGQVMKAWFDVASELGTFFGLLFGYRYAPFTYVQQRFLNVAQAVETYHRAHKNGTVMPQEEFYAIHRSIIEATPASRREWLNQRLRHSNEPSFRRRILDLYDASSDVMTRIAPRDEFAARVADTRNYHTHHSPELKDKAATEPADVHYLTEKLRILAESSVLQEVGLTGERRFQLFARNRNYNWVASLPLHS